MLVLKLELWRRGQEDDKVELGRLLISNDGSSPRVDSGNYVAHVRSHEWPCQSRTMTLKDWPRLDFSPWALVAAFLARIWNVEIRDRISRVAVGEPGEDDALAYEAFFRLNRRLYPPENTP